MDPLYSHQFSNLLSDIVIAQTIGYGIFLKVFMNLIPLFRRSKPDTHQDKTSPVIGFDRHLTYIVATKTVINSDVKLQEDMLTTTVSGGITCEKNKIGKKSNNINAHINSYSNNKYTEW